MSEQGISSSLILLYALDAALLDIPFMQLPSRVIFEHSPERSATLLECTLLWHMPQA